MHNDSTGLHSHPPTPKRKNSCLGCGFIILTLFVLSLVAGYATLFHTSLPAKMVVYLLNKSPKVQIEGISGSISSGFSIQSAHLTDENGNVNFLKEAKFLYEFGSDKFTINELHIGSGEIYSQSSDSSNKSNDHQPSDTSSANTNANYQFVIKKASINNLTIHDIDSGQAFKLNGIQIRNLSIDDTFSIDHFSVDSSTCKISIDPIKGETNHYAFTASFEPSFHEILTSTLQVDGSIETKGTSVRTDLKLMDGSMLVETIGNNQQALTVSNLNPAAYFAKLPPISNINGDMHSNDDHHTIKGSFLFADKRFEIDQQFTTSHEDQQPPIIATHQAGTTTYTLKLIESANDQSMVQCELVSDPPLPLEQALAGLLFNQQPDTLTEEQSSQLKDAAAHFRN